MWYGKRDASYLMRLRYIFEIIDLVNTCVHLVFQDEVEKLVGVGLELFSGEDVLEERRSQNLDVLGGESTVLQSSVESRHTDQCSGHTHAIASGGTAPLAFPKLASVPFLAKQSRLRSKVDFPTLSNTALTPSPFVTSITLLLTSS